MANSGGRQVGHIVKPLVRIIQAAEAKGTDLPTILDGIEGTSPPTILDGIVSGDDLTVLLGAAKGLTKVFYTTGDLLAGAPGNRGILRRPRGRVAQGKRLLARTAVELLEDKDRNKEREGTPRPRMWALALIAAFLLVTMEPMDCDPKWGCALPSCPPRERPQASSPLHPIPPG